MGLSCHVPPLRRAPAAADLPGVLPFHSPHTPLEYPSMIAWTSTQRAWLFIGLLLACYLAICTRTAFRMARTGRNFWFWLVVSVLLTSIPATFVLMRDRIRDVSPARRRRQGSAAAPGRCVHCGRWIGPAGPDDADGLAVCPHCHLPIDEANVG